ncbi:hypothetical protein JCM10213_002886 [Rhodosporidiobolus nylandii]
MRFPVALTSLLALAATASARHGSPLRERSHSHLVERTCAPTASDFLFNVLAWQNHNIGFVGHGKTINKVATRITDENNQMDNLMWNVKETTGGKYEIQTSDGVSCLQTRAEGQKVIAGTCGTSKVELEIVCLDCGTSDCGDPYARKCWIKSVAHAGQCIARQDAHLVSMACDDVTKGQIWYFELA